MFANLLHKKSSSFGLLSWFVSLGLLFVLPLDRSMHLPLLGLYAAAFLGYLLIAFAKLSSKVFLCCFITLCVLSQCQMPWLSDDYYRFFWDAAIMDSGFSPYAFSPRQFLILAEEIEGLNGIFPLLNSPDYYSIYLPVNQYMHWLAFKVGGEDLNGFVIALRAFYAIVLLSAFLLFQRFSSHAVQKNYPLFFANPLLWIEGLGNLHVEIFLASSLIIAAVFYAQHRAKSGVAFLIGLFTKLSSFPMVLAAFIFARKMKTLFYLAAGALVFLVAHITLFPYEDFLHILESLRLFQRTFEFNASVYALVNTLLSNKLGYNAIAFTGPFLSFLGLVMVILLAVYYSFRKLRGMDAIHAAADFFIWASVLYLLLSPVVHPWYLLLPLSAVLFRPNAFLVAWTGTVMLSYLYYPELKSSWWIWVEYLLPFLVLLVSKRLGSGMKIQ